VTSTLPASRPATGVRAGDPVVAVDVVYRGPFQGRRIAFLLDALAQLGGPRRFVWLCPRDDWREASTFLDDAMAARGDIEAVALDGRPQGLPAALRTLSDRRRPRPALTLAVGFTSLPFARAVGAERLVWCVNGIPEERILHHDGPRQRAVAAAMWRGARLGRAPDAAVTVSQPMAELVRRRIGDMPTFVAPTVVDRSTFRARRPGPGVLTYIGSGAPWQNLPLLAEIWSALHRLDPALRFRVVSRDDRADVLRRALPADAVEAVRADSPAAVAEQLRDTQLGFIVRRPHVVNTVAYPTKFGEYVASGVGVVTTDIGWDIAGLVRSTGCGVVLDVDEAPGCIAERVAGFLADDHSTSDALAAACDAAAAQLDRAAYIEQLGAFLADLVD
jgi:glycosyltransferase involved in cell wall biosynthesis